MSDLDINPGYQGTVMVDPSKIPFNIICNGFRMIDVIAQVLNDNTYIDCGNSVISGDIEEVAKKIQDAFAVKMGLKQG